MYLIMCYACVSHTLGGVPCLLTVDFNFPSAKHIDEASSGEEIT